MPMFDFQNSLHISSLCIIYTAIAIRSNSNFGSLERTLDTNVTVSLLAVLGWPGPRSQCGHPWPLLCGVVQPSPFCFCCSIINNTSHISICCFLHCYSKLSRTLICKVQKSS